MKTIFVLLAIALPTFASAADYLNVTCYISSGASVQKSFEGFIYGSSKTLANRVVVEGQNVLEDTEHRADTPATCMDPRELETDYNGQSYWRDAYNTKVYKMGFTTVELSCALGSVVLKYGPKENFIKAMTPRSTSSEFKPYCLDFSGLE